MTTTPLLNIAVMETYNPKILSVADMSSYPLGLVVQNPYIEITPPGLFKTTIVFNPKSVNAFDSITLGVSTNQQGSLPDGLYKLRYSIQPNYENFVELSYFKIDVLKELYDRAYLMMGMTVCDTPNRSKIKLIVDEAEMYIQGVMAAANSCNDKLATDFYNKAFKLLSKLECYVSDL